jgi:Leucyl/phenylalanyl-tRNA protein transferase
MTPISRLLWGRVLSCTHQPAKAAIGKKRVLLPQLGSAGLTRNLHWRLPPFALGAGHKAGVAHSAEAWWEGQLAGGIYGVSLGRAFFGESMFARISNASKVAFFSLSQRPAQWEFPLIDCQITNPHLVRLGAYEISCKEFLRRLAATLQFPTRRGQWG